MKNIDTPLNGNDLKSFLLDYTLIRNTFLKGNEQES